MGNEEFDEQAREVASTVVGRGIDARIAAACRGSGNPAALAWLAEGVGLGPGSKVIDFGAGLGGPAAWLSIRYGCRVVASDPAAGAVEGADRLFDQPVLRSTADAVAVRSGAFDAACVLGVLSVVQRPVAVLREARRVADRLALLEWCSTEDGAVEAGGSSFPTPEDLQRMAVDAGWSVRQETTFDLPVPSIWAEAAAAVDVEPDDDEAEVAAAIDAGRLRTRLLVAEQP